MLCLTAAACSSSGADNSGDSSTVAVSSAAPVETTPVTSSLPAETTSSSESILASVGTVGYSSDDGYNWIVDVAAGPIRGATEPGSDQSLIDACGADPDTAGFLPLSITMTSTAAGFDEDTAASFRLTNDTSDNHADFPYGVYWTGTFSDGPQCDDASTASGEPWTISHSQLSPGESTTTHGGLVIANWKSPDYPDGDPSYEDLALCQPNISSQFNVPVIWTATYASGPSVIDTNYAGNDNIFCHWFLPLTP